MIRLTEELAIKIEVASQESFEQYGDRWSALSHQQVLDQVSRNLGLLNEFDGFAIEHILESVASSDFMTLCVQLSVCQKILNKGEIPSGGPCKVI